MKKIIFIAIVAVASLASCKKDRVCTCTETSTEPGYVGSTDVTTYTKCKKGDAKAACVSYKYTDATTNYTYTGTCTLK